MVSLRSTTAAMVVLVVLVVVGSSGLRAAVVKGWFADAGRGAAIVAVWWIPIPTAVRRVVVSTLRPLHQRNHVDAT
jgi:hypothetical protein